MKQIAPVLVQEHGIGLEGVADGLSSPAVLFLKPDQLLEKRQTGQRRLSALERENAVRVRVEQIRIHQALERVQGHAAPRQRAVGVGIAVQVKAVLAVQIADG